MHSRVSVENFWESHDFGRPSRPTTLVLDNAPVHTSGKFNAQLDRWEERGLTIFRLPTYSPELNPIEGFWKKLKYQFMPTDAWDKFTSASKVANCRGS